MTEDKDTSAKTDVAIIGGGLAGLTLALQLKQTNADISVVVVERNTHPLPVAIHKVGESTVEIGAHYLAEILGQRDHLDTHHLPKFGLRCFFGDANEDLSVADEFGVSHSLSVPTYQIDRGVLENHLAKECEILGAQFWQGARVKSLALRDKNGSHQLVVKDDDGERVLQCRWVVDAAGRSSLIKHNLGLADKSHHHGNAIWFRVAERISVDDWSADKAWQDRIEENPRWLSTNHLMGPGYWVWLIPLASGATSVGIVTDPTLHSIDDMRNFPDVLKWLEQHQSRCADALRDCSLLDFRLLRNYSYDCKQVYSEQRWALTGEAGVFLDPFYSPGTDFIAIANTMIADLIVRDFAGEKIRSRVRQYDQLYFSFFNNSLLLYKELYPGFGDRHLMMTKMVWDYAYYWGILSLFFFRKSVTDLDVIAKTGIDLFDVAKRNKQIQTVFKNRAAQMGRLQPSGIFIDQKKVPCLKRFNEELNDSLNKESLVQRIRDNSKILLSLADMLEGVLRNETSAEFSGEAEAELIGDLRRRLAA